ncbi:MAG TPA: tryptophan-rich sensory protein [Rhodopila sp.]|nr:tryptophan-rich sensory protein [Rhodopila sp.]
MKSSRAAALAIGAVLTAAVTGGSFGPQRPRTAIWYAALRKPPGTPPGPAIGAAWGVLDVLLCLTGYRLLRREPSRARTAALACWAGSLAGLAGFPAVFFGLRRLGPSAAVSAGMFASAGGTALAAASIDSTAALTSLPLVLWTGFATALSEELWRRN